VDTDLLAGGLQRALGMAVENCIFIPRGSIPQSASVGNQEMANDDYHSEPRFQVSPERVRLCSDQPPAGASAGDA
jgi:hypothetical protein